MVEDPTLVGREDRYDPQRQREVLARFVDGLAARRLTAPAIFMLEASRPLSFVASQSLIFLKPIVQGLLGIRDYEVFAAAIENRDNLDWLVRELEAAEEGRRHGDA